MSIQLVLDHKKQWFHSRMNDLQKLCADFSISNDINSVVKIKELAEWVLQIQKDIKLLEKKLDVESEFHLSLQAF